jgi:DNA-binding transcriptional LysR family regulator
LLDIREERLDEIFIRPGDDELDGLRLKRFADEKMLIVLPDGHPLARREILPLAALAGEPFVLPGYAHSSASFCGCIRT